MSHTKEPWVLDGENRHDSHDALLGVYFAHKDGGRVGQTFANCLADDEACKANARRIVACVNACAGIPSIVLEASSSGGLPWAFGDMLEITMQRDKLLEALKASSDWIANAPHGDNCFVSSHYDGDPGDRCNCGKDSIEYYIDGVIEEIEATK